MASDKTMWPSAHSDMLSNLIATTSLSFSEITASINATFKTSYTRNAVLGRAYRMNQCISRPLVPPEMRAERERTRQIRCNEKRRAERRIAKPWLADRAPKVSRAEEKKRIRAMFDATGTSRTSAGYRKHLPKLPEMSRTELRSMLADAMRNTAAMGVS
jgi:GcrA cell cycle regulator